jgi:hypothetical protein
LHRSAINRKILNTPFLHKTFNNPNGIRRLVENEYHHINKIPEGCDVGRKEARSNLFKSRRDWNSLHAVTSLRDFHMYVTQVSTNISSLCDLMAKFLTRPFCIKISTIPVELESRRDVMLAEKKRGQIYSNPGGI